MTSFITTSNGDPVLDNQHSLTAGSTGPILLQDFALIDKLAHFDRERIPERVVHAKGAGAHGYFECTNDQLSQWTKAKFLSRAGIRTPVFVRFSTVGGEKGSADTERDPRGFAVKFYTEEGNWDMVGNNTPVFFIRDPIKFPDFIHTQKRNSQSNLKDPDAFWDFLSLVPESIHQVSILFSDRGTPDVQTGYRCMNGYSSHTLKFVNAKSEEFFVKFHFKTDQGIKNLTDEKATELAGKDPDHATRDLFEAIKNQKFPSWTVNIQLMTAEQAKNYQWNILDVTKVWAHKDFPLIPIGKLVLNRNPENYFADTEQSAFSPSHVVPGIEPSFDKMLQGRLFSYPDTHRHRLGANYTQIPVNRPRNCPVMHQQRDGFMSVDGNGGALPNYEPNSYMKKVQTTINHAIRRPNKPEIIAARHPVPLTDDDFIQAGNLYSIQPTQAKARMIKNVAGHLCNTKPHILKRQLEHFKKANFEYGRGIEKEVVGKVGSKF